jgi:hypothetical protein
MEKKEKSKWEAEEEEDKGRTVSQIIAYSSKLPEVFYFFKIFPSTHILSFYSCAESPYFCSYINNYNFT